MTRIRELRKKMKISAKEAAKRLEVPYTTYINYEVGDREPNSEMLVKIAQFYDTSVDYLIGVTNQKAPITLPGDERQKKEKLLREIADQLDEAGLQRVKEYADFLISQQHKE